MQNLSRLTLFSELSTPEMMTQVEKEIIAMAAA
jgi:hypothetical protein